MGSLSLPPPIQLASSQTSINRSCWSSGDELSTLLSSWKPYAKDGPECEGHGATSLFWCGACVKGLCGQCVKDHPSSDKHQLSPLSEANADLQTLIEAESLAVGNLLSEVYNFERKQQDLTMKLIEALGNAKSELESALVSGSGLVNQGELAQIHSLLTSPRPYSPNLTSSGISPSLLSLHKSLSLRRSELTSLLSSSHPLLSLTKCLTPASLDSLRLIHSFTTTRLGKTINANTSVASSGINLTMSLLPSLTLTLGPRFYFDMEIVGVQTLGRIIIETRPDVAPRMCDNFHSLVRGERGFGFEGCVVFQCWRGESVITGDFEHQNGRGGHSIFPSGLFMPEDTRLPATRGALGMRRTQKRHDSKGLVGSQFRIILQDMPGFTGIFGHVLDGIEVVERISECGDASGNPMKRVVVRRCGEV